MTDSLLILGVIAIISVGALAFTTSAPAGEFSRIAKQPTIDPIPICSDSDGGYNPYVRGTCRDLLQRAITGRYTDTCTDNINLQEFFCGNQSTCESSNFFCSYGCEEGACRNQTLAWCEDTDGGLNYYEFGTVYGQRLNGSNYSYNDNCIHAHLLRERYCVGTHPMVYEYECEFGCSWGECFNGTYNDTTPPVLEEFIVEYVSNYTNESYIYLYAFARDSESGLYFRGYNFSGPTYGERQEWPCGGETCHIETSRYNPEPGYWTVSADFTNHVGLSVEDSRTIYVPG